MNRPLRASEAVIEPIAIAPARPKTIADFPSNLIFYLLIRFAERIARHDAGTGAKYTRGRGPLAVLAVRRCRGKGKALRLEYAIKQLTRVDKEALVADPVRIATLARRV